MTNYHFSKEILLGYTLSGFSLLAAKLSISGSRFTIESLDTFSVEEPVNPLDTSNTKGIITAAFPSAKTLVRPLELAVTKTKDIDATFLFEAESLLPYPIEKCIIDKVRIGRTKSSSELQLFAATKEDLKTYLDFLREYDIETEVLCPKALALCHFAQFFLPKDDLHILIDIDENETTFVLVRQGLPLFCRAHPAGLNALRLSKESDSHLSELHQYLRELARILLSLETSSYSTQSLPILFTGPVVDNRSFIELLTGFLNKQSFEEPSIPSQIQIKNGYSWQDICQFAVSIGTALSFHLLKKEMSSVNFRKEELAFGDKWRHWKKELIAYFSLIALLTGALFLFSELSLEKSRVTLVEKYAELVSTIEKTPEEVEKEYAKSLDTDDTAIDITSLSSEEIKDRLYFLENHLSSRQEEMVLHPDIPRVSDLLEWLSNHPKVGNNQEETLQLQQLSYFMIKRPEKGKLRDRYSVRVELEFSAPNPTMAREFHDALLAPNTFVDPKNEVKWSVQKNRYRITFFLKDKTHYPQNLSQGSLHASN